MQNFVTFKMVEKVLKFKELKDEFIVRYYMCEADRCKSRGAFFETFLNLNKALACVMPGVSVSIVMQLRSELYDLLQMPRESLQSLQWAESHDASVDLTERKVACEVAIASDVIPPDATLALRLTHTPNPTIPYISSCLKLRTSVKFGNHVFTGRNLAIGDVICIEKPLFGGMYAEDGSANHEKDSHFQRCFHCFSYSNMNLFPCENCNFVLFCSLMCQQEAHNIYHKYECSINMKLHGVQHIVLSMRSFFFALYLHNGSIAELRAAIEARAGAPPMTIFDCDARDPESLERARNLMYVFHSYKAEPRATKNNVFAMIFRLLPELSVMWQGNEDFILTFLARHINNSRELEQELTQWPGNTPDIFGQMTSPQPNACDNYFIRKVVGHAYYPFVGLLNHSCVENVHRHIDQHLKTILIVSRPIKAGQQLFLNYK